MHGSEGTLHQICTWITQEFGYEVAERRNWKNTVSASLSAGEQFVKGEEKEKGSGSIWRLVQTHNDSHSAYSSYSSSSGSGGGATTAYAAKHTSPYHHHNNNHHQQHQYNGNNNTLKPHSQQQQQHARRTQPSGGGGGGGGAVVKPDDRTRVGYLVSSAGEVEDGTSDDIAFDNNATATRNSRPASIRGFGNPGSLLEIVVDVLRRHDGEGSLEEILRWTREAYPQIATLMDARTWDNKVHDCLMDRANARYFVQQQQRQTSSFTNLGIWHLLSTPSSLSGGAAGKQQQNGNNNDIDWGAAVRGEETTDDDIYSSTTTTINNNINGTSTIINHNNNSSTRHSIHHQIKPDCTTWSERIDYVLAQHGGEGTATEICEWIEQAYPESIVGKENWRRTVSASLSTDEGIQKCPPRWGEKAAVWRLKSTSSKRIVVNGAHSNTDGRRSSHSSDSEAHNSDDEDDEEAHVLLSFVRHISSGSGSSSDSETGRSRRRGAVNKMSIQTMLNGSIDDEYSSSEEEEESGRDSDADSEDSEREDGRSDMSSESEEEDEEDYGTRSRSARPSSAGSAASKKYNSISWPEKITAVMLKYGGGQGRAGDICKWIQAEYMEDIDDSKNWKNTVSAFLSNNKRFIKGEPQGVSRAAVWKLSSIVDDNSDSATNNDLSRKRRRPAPTALSKREQPSPLNPSRGGVVTRALSGQPPAKRRRFESARRSRFDSSDEEEEEDQMNGADSDGQIDDAATTRGARGSRRSSFSGSGRSHVTTGGKPTQQHTSSVNETNSSATASKPKAEQKKMWPDRIEEVLLKHGGQGMAHEIHRWIEEDFLEDTIGKPGWKNLVSAHLSSNKKFVREQRAGKQGGVWILRGMQHQSSERRQPVTLLARDAALSSSSQPAAAAAVPPQQQPVRLPAAPLQPSAGRSIVHSLEDDNSSNDEDDSTSSSTRRTSRD